MAILNKSDAKKIDKTAIQGKLAWLFLLILPFVCAARPAYSVESAMFYTANDDWAILGGYGQSVPGWGQTNERVETLDLIPRYNHHIFDNIGSGWYRGFHSLLLELPVSVVVSPDVSAILGINFLASYTFTTTEQWQPYLFGGGGPVYSFADIPGMGADLNGNYQFGIGLNYHLDTHRKLLFELRYHHISNGGSEEPNVPLNSCKLLVGVTF
jgi:hypothetical protein